MFVCGSICEIPRQIPRWKNNVKNPEVQIPNECCENINDSHAAIIFDMGIGRVAVFGAEMRFIFLPTVSVQTSGRPIALLAAGLRYP